MKQLQLGNSNTAYEQYLSGSETMKYFLVTGRFQTVYNIGQNVAWQDLGPVGVATHDPRHK